MIGKVITAFIGGKLAQNTKGIDGTTGAIIGAAVPMVLRRISLPGMLALGAAGYVAKKVFDGKDETKSASTLDRTPVSSTTTGDAVTSFDEPTPALNRTPSAATI